MKGHYYVLFRDHTTGMELYNGLKELGIRAVIAPTPRSLSRCCGISLMVLEEDVDVIREYVSAHQIPVLDIAWLDGQPDRYRDRFC